MKLYQKIASSLLLLTIGIPLVGKSCTQSTCQTSCNDCTELCRDTCITNLCHRGDIYGKTFYAARSQGDNSARKIMGTDNKIHLFGNKDFYAVGFAAVEYQSLFNNHQTVGEWFSTNGLASMSYGVIDTSSSNNQFDINSLQFGVTGSGTLAFCPQSDDIIIDLNVYFGLDNLFCGLWGRLDIPVARSARSLTLLEEQSGNSSSVYPTDLYGSGAVTVPSPLAQPNPMTVALKGGADSVFGTGLGAVPALSYGKVSPCKRTVWNVAGIRLDLGYDWFRRERWHITSSYQFVLPLGSTPSAEYLFDAMVADSKRAQFGGTYNVRYDLWQHCDGDHIVSFYGDATVNTMLGRYVERLIGINPRGATPEQSVWSQYLVLKKFNSSLQLTGLERAANLLATRMKVHANVDVDIAMMLQWNGRCAFAGLGYEFWLRSREHVTHACLAIPANTYAIKGVTDATTAAADASLLVAPNATINTVGTTVTVSAQSMLPSNASSPYYDYDRALHATASSNKVFGFLGYNWTDYCAEPFVLVGAEAEFGTNNTALSQWGVLIKGGLSY